jgi:hypothetical protein
VGEELSGIQTTRGVEQINREKSRPAFTERPNIWLPTGFGGYFTSMMKRKTAGLIAGGIGIAVVIGAYWWLESSTRPSGHPAPEIGIHAPVAGSQTPQTPISPALPGSADGAVTSPAEGEGINEETSVAAEVPSAGPTVGDILAEPDENYVRVAKKLSAIALNPRVPMVEREEALAHVLNLSAGNEAEVLTPLVKDPNLPDALAETILAEALNRPLSYQADLYLEALAARKSPEMQASIREHLVFLTGGDDKGANPADWAEAIKAAKASWPQ